MKRHLPSLLLLSSALVACQSSGGWKVPTAVVELYDVAAEDGMLELELERDGTLVEAEADVPLDRVPENVVAAAQAAYPGVRLTGAEREVQDGSRVWEVKFSHEGRAMELVIDDDGEVLETERELRADEAPEAVLAAAEAAIPNSAFRSVEEIRAGDGLAYHVKRLRGGASYKVVLDVDGTVLRKVREARAEIEIPLAD